MKVRATTTPVPFLMAITSDSADPDVSAMLTHYGAMEGGITRVREQRHVGVETCYGGQGQRVVPK